MSEPSGASGRTGLSRVSAAVERGALASVIERGALASVIKRFALAPASAAPLAALRIGLAAVLLTQAALVAPVLFELYGPAGILQEPLRDAFTPHDLPGIGWLTELLAPLGIGEAPILVGTGALYVLSLAALLCGLKTRVAALLAWSTHRMLMVTADPTVYGADVFANIFLFYLLWVPSGAALSLDQRARRSRRALAGATDEPTPGARLGLRIVQLHLCIVYLASGLEKACGHSWWNGEAIWRSVMLPEYRQLDFSWLASRPWVAQAAGWSVLAVELGYAFLIWPRLTRRAVVVATSLLHLGIAAFMGLGVFGAIMPVLTLAAFGVPAEPRAPSPRPELPRAGGG
ncbi:HTTM domain-containing protein [Sorangium sp. So ce375]|uniref:HTTM domain-containing protein n=1 Tax=Sorangium sp. So ce375 TaxID=3133306 RepID=UPI003F5BF250